MKGYRMKVGGTLRFTRFDSDDYKKTDQGIENAKATRSVLIVLQGMDTSGKDGTIKSVMSGVNPQGCKVVSFKAPLSEEREHDFLWHVHQQAPSKGQIGIFNRSHYEDVLITRVHGWVSDKVATKGFNQIKEFEELLYGSGTTMLKFFLHISKDEQKGRLGWVSRRASGRDDVPSFFSLPGR